MISRIIKKIVRTIRNISRIIKKKVGYDEIFPKIIKKIVDYWVYLGIIKDTERDVYEYGLELVLSSAVNITVVIVTALFTKKLPESIALLAVIIPLQSFGGGYHAKTHLRCFLIMFIGWWVVIPIIPFITLSMGILIACISLVTIFILAPVRHVNVPISDEQFHKMKLLVRCFSIGTAVIGIAVSLLVVGSNIGSSMIIGMGAVALSILVSKFNSEYQELIGVNK
jgi:accessory gene regulator B